MLKIQEGFDLPENPDPETIYKLLPKNPDPAYYWERVDRNIGWITKAEQEILKNSIIGVSGCGGMGGQLAEKFLRLGVGEIRIADCEVFDVSNINRQFGATRFTVGKSKAFETARMLRAISDDFTLVIYPQGISERSVNQFVAGCDVILDEIEFFAVSARILLHQKARLAKIPVINCNVVGFGSRLFLFTPDSMTMEELLDLSYQKALVLEKDAKQGSVPARKELIQKVLKGLVPELPEYKIGDRDAVLERLQKEGRASIFAANPPLATGLVSDRTALYLLRNSGVKRNIAEIPEMPGYLYFDAATMKAKIKKFRWT